MKRTALHALFTLLFCLLALQPVCAAVPKPGRYKGTMTIRNVVDGTNAQVKKVIPVAGILVGANLQFVITELPPFNTFTSYTFNSNILDGSVTLYPNGNAQPVTLSDVKTTASSIKGTVDFGVIAPPTGGADARRFLDLTLTRVGN